MADRKILLNMVLGKFNGLKLDSFADRLVLQKRLYLLQLFGLDLGYRYNWYVHGPYCPTLTEEAFAVQQGLADIKKTSQSFELSEAAKDITEDYLQFEASLGESDIAKSLELAASIHFLKHIGFVPGGVTKSNIKKALETKGKEFSDEQFNQAWNALDNFGLIETKKRL